MQVNRWRPYNLSLPGRICIAKSMMYSQLNYIGCFLTIPECFISIYDNMITGFVKGKLNIARKVCIYFRSMEVSVSLTFQIS
jgi:hypothetical protein